LHVVARELPAVAEEVILMTDEPNAKHHFLTAVCVLLAIAIVGMAWYAYPMLKTHDASLHNLPGLTQTVDNIGDRLREAESKAADSSNGQRSLRDQVNDLSRNLRARIETVSKQASQSAEEAYHKLQARIDTEIQAQTERLANVNERVSRLESSRDADQVQIAQLKQQLNQVREQSELREQAAQRGTAQQSSDLAQVRQQMEENRSGETQELAGLKREQDRDRRNINAVSDQIAVRKIPFEATKNRSSDLGEGISLYIDNTNTAYRRVSGYMWIASDRRNIWLRNQSVQEPVIFYGYQDGQKRELVLTNVTKNSVTGYLVLPKATNQTAKLGSADAGIGATAQ
jgi:hypothetical protein